MQEFPWLKYLISILGVCLLVALVAKFITNNAFILIVLAIGSYRLLFQFYSKSVSRKKEPFK